MNQAAAAGRLEVWYYFSRKRLTREFTPRTRLMSGNGRKQFSMLVARTEWSASFPVVNNWRHGVDAESGYGMS